MGNGLAAPAAMYGVLTGSVMHRRSMFLLIQFFLSLPRFSNWATAGGQAHVNGYVAVSHLPGSTLVVSIAPSVSGTFTQLASFSAAAGARSIARVRL